MHTRHVTIVEWVCGKGSSKVKMTITRGLLFPSCVPRPKELLAVAAPALA